MCKTNRGIYYDSKKDLFVIKRKVINKQAHDTCFIKHASIYKHKGGHTRFTTTGYLQDT